MTKAGELIDAANKALEDGEPERAVKLLEEALELEPNSARVLNHLAEAHMGMGSDEAALRLLDKALEIDPKHASSLENKALLTLDYKGPKAAIPIMKRALDADPGRTDNWVHLANMHIDNGEPKEAKTAAKRALELEPESDDALISLAEAHSLLDESNDADAIYKRLLSRIKDEPYVYRSYAQHLCDTNRFGEALAMLRKAKKLDPTDKQLDRDMEVVETARLKTELALERQKRDMFAIWQKASSQRGPHGGGRPPRHMAG